MTDQVQYTGTQVLGSLIFLLAVPVAAAGALALVNSSAVLIGLWAPWGWSWKLWNGVGLISFLLGVAGLHLGMMLRYPQAFGFRT